MPRTNALSTPRTLQTHLLFRDYITQEFRSGHAPHFSLILDLLITIWTGEVWWLKTLAFRSFQISQNKSMRSWGHSLPGASMSQGKLHPPTKNNFPVSSNRPCLVAHTKVEWHFKFLWRNGTWKEGETRTLELDCKGDKFPQFGQLLLAKRSAIQTLFCKTSHANNLHLGGVQAFQIAGSIVVRVVPSNCIL
jgi:hypothetical protein